MKENREKIIAMSDLMWQLFSKGDENLKTKILRMLKTSDGYVSGQVLCDTFGVSRTAVWKVIHQLKEEGYEIEAASKKGYCMIGVPDILSKEEIESQMETKWAGRIAAYFDEVDSTNTKAKFLAEEGAVHGTLVVAEQQNAGKGRRGRSWNSQKGSGIWMTLILKPDILPQSASMITLIAALAIAKSVKKQYALDAKIKWPNDIVVNGKKICGILTEMSSDMESINHIVIGIGINANTKTFPEDIQDRATSISIEKENEIINRSSLIADIMKEMEGLLDIFFEKENLAFMKEEYESYLINIDRKVRILEPKSEYTGISLGIGNNGDLIVKLEDGTIKEVMSGEVSVRGLYGYTD